MQPRAARTFAEALAPAGFDARALTPSYGMAEATLGIAISPAGRGLRTLHIDRAAHERCGFVVPAEPRDPTAFEVASCGFTGAGHTLRMVDASGSSLPEGQVGEVAFSGPSVSAGYFRDAAASAETFQRGELRTGDLGFLWEGELFVSGRKKELIIVHGRNYYPLGHRVGDHRCGGRAPWWSRRVRGREPRGRSGGRARRARGRRYARGSADNRGAGPGARRPLCSTASYSSRRGACRGRRAASCSAGSHGSGGSTATCASGAIARPRSARQSTRAVERRSPR